MGKIKISLKTMTIFNCFVLIVPLIVFMLTWLNLPIGLLMTILAVSATLFYVKHTDKSDKIEVDIKKFIIALIILLLFVWITGLGGFFYQTFDNHARNAIFRDMINEGWPIIYDTNKSALVYYHLFWIIPSVVGKILGWQAANIMLLIQGWIFLTLTVINIVFATKNKYSILKISLIFIGFSGLNIVGQYITQMIGWSNNAIGMSTCEGWLDFARNGYDCSYLYRGTYDSVCQIYNQALPAWLVTSLYLSNSKTRNCAFIGLLLLPYGPIPFVGLFMLITCEQIIKFMRNDTKINMIKEVFSIENIFGVVYSIIFVLYFACNETGTKFATYVPLSEYNIERIVTLLMFYFLEFGIYYLLAYQENKNQILWKIAFALLLVIPLFKVGNGRDFCMNASLAPLFIILVGMINTLSCENNRRNALRVCIIIASFSLFLGIGEKIFIMRTINQFPVVADDAYSYSERYFDETDYDPFNYLAPNYNDSFFYKYLAKKN